MGNPSPSYQIKRCLQQVTLTEDHKRALKAEFGSVKRALRDNFDLAPRDRLPLITSKSTAQSYFKAAKTFFGHARELTGERYMKDWLKPEAIRATFEHYYDGRAMNYLERVWASLQHVADGAHELGWIGQHPLTPEMREEVMKGLARDYGEGTARGGFLPGDAERIVDYFRIQSETLENPFRAQVSYRWYMTCRVSYEAGLRPREAIYLSKAHLEDRDGRCFIVTHSGLAKGGRVRQIPINRELYQDLMKMNGLHPLGGTEGKYHTWYRAVGAACAELGIAETELHRFRGSYARNQLERFMVQGMSEAQARERLTHLLGHNRIEVTYKYVSRQEAVAIRSKH